jgi:pyridoxamine 5'-phosphate oxidase
VSAPDANEPLLRLADWLADARKSTTQRNPDAMTLATSDERGNPSARIVLCKRLDPEAGCIVFFTNYGSRKARQLDARPRAAAVLHWDELGRQARLEGPVTRSPKAESDAYFATRHPLSRIGAWASRQSEPLADQQDLDRRIREGKRRFPDWNSGQGDIAIERPPFWGGFRLWIERIELWREGGNRIHEREEWRRHLEPVDDGFSGGAWKNRRLYP